ncbi:DUF6503 family protein [Aquimarina sp. 2201CG5-10]|uniref:DUF6503 family protein n=1 Tax=Aquimarina callyspongiae TaxID=3098150 RepID=UPI002AB448A9|nr:DUF6503 family protein [Aquimarina sp. 2201CG5-10]MDY8137718.1 DUF6503 family protein [Aquimarina sp. 2201CG5-10]
MKKLTVLLFAVTVFLSCNQQTKPEKETIAKEEPKEEIVPDRSKDFPADIAAVFKAHGGIQAFDQQNTLIFELANPEGNEKHTTDLKTRHARIETDKFALGFDGEEAWIEQDSTYFKGNPRFYHNLMFYFYAMPFVLGDDGITYEKVEDLTVGDTKYPGYKVSYGDGVGDSPKDNYFLYYDASTHQMKYLGYTVTFFSKETSERVSLIEYSDWNDVNGLILPKTLKWMDYKEGVVGEVKSERNFVNAKASKEKAPTSLFKKPTIEKGGTL